jgi:hypothetical protein
MDVSDRYADITVNGGFITLTRRATGEIIARERLPTLDQAARRGAIQQVAGIGLAQKRIVILDPSTGSAG